MIRGKIIFIVLLIITLTLLFIFQIFPMLYMIIGNIYTGDNILNSIKFIFTDKVLVDTIFNTLIIGIVVTIITILLAIIVAITVLKTDMPFANTFDKIFFAGYIIPPFVITMAWVILLNRNIGVINIFLRNFLATNKFSINIYSISGIIFVMVMFYFPFAYMIIKNALKNVDSDLEESASIYCCSKIKIIFNITLPQIYNTIISASVAIFISAVSSYVIPLIVGNPAGINTITTKIFEFMQIGDIDSQRYAMILSLILIIISSIILMLVLKFGNKVKGNEKRFEKNNVVIKLGKYKYILSFFMAGFCFIIVILPLIMVFFTGFIKNLGGPIKLNNLTIEHWINVIESKSIITAIKNSLILGFMSAIISVVFSIMIAYIHSRSNIKFRKLPEKLMIFSSILPNIVIAVSLIVTFSGRLSINLYNTIWILCIAYVVKYMYMGFRTIMPAFSDIPLEFEEIASILGAGKFKIMTTIILPIIKSSILIGGFLVIVPTFYELTMSGLLYTSSTITVGIELYSYQVFFSQQMACALASIVILFIIVINLIITFLYKKRYLRGN